MSKNERNQDSSSGVPHESDQIKEDIRQGIEDMKAGRFRTLREVDAELRKKYSIPEKEN